jgi:hypothetical protein
MAAVLLGVFGAGLAAVTAMYRPWTTPAVGYDSAASVIFFDRLAAQQRLEGFVGTTPKPLMTLLDGLGFNLVHDWWPIAILATIEFALMLVVAAALAWRTSGAVAAGMAAFGLLGCQRLLIDGGLTYANPWAILLWLAAGLALTAAAPRYGLAGGILFLAALVRVETFIILALAAAALAVWRFAPGRWVPGGSRPQRRSILLLAGVAAVPVMVLHDWLLTGNGLFWLDVSAIFSRANPGLVQTPSELAESLWQHYAGAWPLALLAVVAVVDLVRRRQAVVLLGLVALGPGVLAFLEYVSYRYTIPADAALVFGAALGAGAVARPLARGLGEAAAGRGRLPAAMARLPAAMARLPAAVARLPAGERGRDRLAVAAAAVAIGAVAAVAFVRPYGPLDRQTWRTINNYRALQANVERALPAISSAVRALPDQPAWIETDISRPTEGPPPRLYVPALLVPRVIVELGLPAWAVGSGSPVQGDPSSLAVEAPTIVYIDSRQGGNVPADDQPLELESAGRVGRVTVEPLLALPDEGLWVVLLTPASD